MREHHYYHAVKPQGFGLVPSLGMIGITICVEEKHKLAVVTPVRPIGVLDSLLQEHRERGRKPEEYRHKNEAALSVVGVGSAAHGH